jgi:flagellar motility protein MotE (MotC chaperone)
MMIRETKSGWTSALLLAAALPVAFLSSLPAGAQGWNAELTDAPKPAPAAGRRLTRAAAARAAARAQAHTDVAKRETVQEKTQATLPEPSQAPVGAAPFIPPRSAEPAVPHEPAGPASARAAAAAEEQEPDDPFVDIHVNQRPAGGEVETTQVVPGSPGGASIAVGPSETSAASQYCTNIADAAIDARIAWQRQNLAEVEKEIQKRTAELEARTAEFQRWLQRRNDFAEKAKKTVVDIYTKMKPDAAALQLQALDEETAAAVIIKLDPRSASAVMNEMDPTQAARLTAIISGAAKLPGKPRPPTPQGNRS